MKIKHLYIATIVTGTLVACSLTFFILSVTRDFYSDHLRQCLKNKLSILQLECGEPALNYPLIYGVGIFGGVIIALVIAAVFHLIEGTKKKGSNFTV